MYIRIHFLGRCGIQTIYCFSLPGVQLLTSLGFLAYGADEVRKSESKFNRIAVAGIVVESALVIASSISILLTRRAVGRWRYWVSGFCCDMRHDDIDLCISDRGGLSDLPTSEWENE